ncbi:hypothetical protein CFC21_049781 [Triticum aestivum]|uniref:F-box domain-containing protein n=2 Tax=Triticum aestivum TaxID=4565 RepID=A0A9R1K3T2_WHEAT|nr:uncharacterized protein LOC123075465 [Triticum aestivum]KAF7039835.1 hypothetical protein CFC21_049781 [Triticum aestivum]
MARATARSSRASGAARFLRRQLADRMSDLSDDLLLLVLRRLDTRTALGAGSISRRWAHLPRELSALDLKVSDILPPRYHRWVLLHRDIYGKAAAHLQYRRHAVRLELLPNIKRYERRAMRALNRSVESLLQQGPRSRRGVLKRLSLEFYTTGNGSSMNRLIAEAIDAWGVEDLDVIAKPLYYEADVVHAFPSHGMCKEPGAASLRSLKLGGCLLPPLHEYGALTMLVLRDIPESTPPAAYEGVLASCPKLQTLHLISCICRSGSGALLPVEVDAPSSEIRELVFDNCKFRWIRLGALPCLESLACMGGTLVFFEYNLIPSLRQYNFALHLGVALEGARQYFAQRLKLELDMFLRCTPNITSLIVRFTGPDRWIVPSSSPLSYLPSLRRLLVTDVPSSLDASWPRLFLEMTPSLEILHINIASCKDKPGKEISWQPSELRQHHLKEFVVAGFEGTKRQIYLVNFAVGACTALRRVALFRNGHAQRKGLWDWEMVTEPHSWTDEKKDYTLKQIMDGVPSSPVQLVFG